MAVLTVTLKNRGAGTWDDSGRKYTEIYQVFTDSFTTTATEILLHPQIPKRWGWTFIGDNFAVVDSVVPEQDEDSPTHWTVTVDYAMQRSDQQNEGIRSKDDRHDPEVTPNPLDRPVIRSWRPLAIETALEQAYNSTAVGAARDDPALNSAGLPYDPPMVRRTYHGVATFVRNEATFTQASALNYIGHCNSAVIAGLDVYTVLCNHISAEEQFETTAQGIQLQFWRVTYEFEHAPESWIEGKLNLGTMQRVNRELQKCIDADGDQVSEPVPLDDNGVQLDADTLPDSATYKYYNPYPSRDFNALGLPFS